MGWNHPGPARPVPRIVSSVRKAGELCSSRQILMFGWQPLCSIITLEEKQMHSSACWEGRCLNCSLGKGVRRDKTQLSSRRLWTWVTSQCRFFPPPNALKGHEVYRKGDILLALRQLQCFPMTSQTLSHFSWWCHMQHPVSRCVHTCFTKKGVHVGFTLLY